MDYLFFVHVMYSFNNFSHDNWSGFFTETVILVKQIEERSITSQFKKQVDIFFITKKIIQFDEIGVIKVGLNFDLSNKLI